MTATIQWRARKLLPRCTCLAASFLLAACQAEPLPAADARTAGWRADLETLVTARESNHPDPWHGIDRASYVAEVDAVAARVPELNDDELLVEITRLAAMPTWNGRDGHGGIHPWVRERLTRTSIRCACGTSATIVRHGCVAAGRPCRCTHHQCQQHDVDEICSRPARPA